MAKKDNKNKKIKVDKKTIMIVALSFLVVVLGAALAVVSLNKRLSDMDEQRLALHQHLLNNYVLEICPDPSGDEYTGCGLVEEGISKDNDLYARIWYQKYNKETHQPIGEKTYRNLYFQHDSGAIDGYAEAFGN